MGSSNNAKNRTVLALGLAGGVLLVGGGIIPIVNCPGGGGQCHRDVAALRLRRDLHLPVGSWSKGRRALRAWDLHDAVVLAPLPRESERVPAAGGDGPFEGLELGGIVGGPAQGGWAGCWGVTPPRACIIPCSGLCTHSHLTGIVAGPPPEGHWPAASGGNALSRYTSLAAADAAGASKQRCSPCPWTAKQRPSSSRAASSVEGDMLAWSLTVKSRQDVEEK